MDNKLRGLVISFFFLSLFLLVEINVSRKRHWDFAFWARKIEKYVTSRVSVTRTDIVAITESYSYEDDSRVILLLSLSLFFCIFSSFIQGIRCKLSGFASSLLQPYTRNASLACHDTTRHDTTHRVCWIYQVSSQLWMRTMART